jgi:hypothetical protein
MGQTHKFAESQLQRIQLKRLDKHGLKVIVNPDAHEVTLTVPEEGVSVDDLLGTLVVDGAGNAFDTSGMPTFDQDNVTSNGGIIIAPMWGNINIGGETVSNPRLYGSGETQKTEIFPSGTIKVTVKRENTKEILLLLGSQEPRVTLEIRPFVDCPIHIEVDEECIWT